MVVLVVMICVIVVNGLLTKDFPRLRMLLYILGLLALALQLLLTTTPAAAQCSPFTRQAQPGMLAIGTVVDIVNYELVAPNTVSAVTRTGTVDEYYITTYCPQAAIFNMDAQAYVIRYGAVDGSRRIVDSGELTVR